MRKLEQRDLSNPFNTKHEQVDASVRFVLQNNKAYYTGLSNLSYRVKESLITIVLDWKEATGYHFNVLRAAQRQYSRGTGYIAAEEPPFTYEEINP